VLGKELGAELGEVLDPLSSPTSYKAIDTTSPAQLTFLLAATDHITDNRKCLAFHRELAQQVERERKNSIPNGITFSANEDDDSIDTACPATTLLM
jgi:hypothetical protein